MTHVKLNDDGDVVAIYANPQPGIESVIEIDDDDSRIAAFIKRLTDKNAQERVM